MRTGRPNKRADHVDSLDVSAGPRERLRVILETISGVRTVEDACGVLSVSRTRFQQLRHQALQGAAHALEPGHPGRPRRRDAAVDARVAALEEALADSERWRRRAEARAMLASVVADFGSSGEKGGGRAKAAGRKGKGKGRSVTKAARG